MNEAVECRWRTFLLGRYGTAKLGQSIANGWLVERLVECIGKYADDLRWSAPGREEPGPDAHHVVDASLLGSWHVRDQRQAICCRDAVGLHRARKNRFHHAD